MPVVPTKTDPVTTPVATPRLIAQDGGDRIADLVERIEKLEWRVLLLEGDRTPRVDDDIPF